MNKRRLINIFRLIIIIITMILLIKDHMQWVAFFWAIYGISWSLPEFLGLTEEIWVNKSSQKRKMTQSDTIEKGVDEK